MTRDNILILDTPRARRGHFYFVSESSSHRNTDELAHIAQVIRDAKFHNPRFSYYSYIWDTRQDNSRPVKEILTVVGPLAKRIRAWPEPNEAKIFFEGLRSEVDTIVETHRDVTNATSFIPELENLLDQIDREFSPKLERFMLPMSGNLGKTAAAVSFAGLIYLAGYVSGKAPHSTETSFDEQSATTLSPVTDDVVERRGPEATYGTFLVTTCGTAPPIAAVAEKRLREHQPELFALWSQSEVTSDLIGRTWYAATDDWGQSAFSDFIPSNPTLESYCELAERLREVADSLVHLSNSEMRHTLPEPMVARLSPMLDFIDGLPQPMPISDRKDGLLASSADEKALRFVRDQGSMYQRIYLEELIPTDLLRLSTFHQYDSGEQERIVLVYLRSLAILHDGIQAIKGLYG